MSPQQSGLEIGPHTTHLHLIDQLESPHPDEAFLRPDQRAALEILTHERHNPQTETIEVVYTDGVERKISVVNMLMNAHVRWGKFEVIMAEFRRFKKENPEAKGLYLAHTVHLVRGARAKFDAREVSRPSDVRLTSGEFHGNRKDNTDVDMLFATIPSMYDRKGFRFPPDFFDYVAADEIHHSKAPTHEALIKGYLRPMVRAGMTATLNRLDQLDPRDIYGEPVIDSPLAEGFVYRRVRGMIYKAMLEQSIRDRVEDDQAGTALLNRMTRSLDYNLSEMILRHEDEIVAEGVTDPRVIYYAQSISQAQDIAAHLNDVVIIHSEQSDKANLAALKAFNSGQVNRIVSVNMLNEGLDIWRPTHLAFFRSTDSENILMQQLGRGLELLSDGSPLYIHDFVANAERLRFLYKLIHAITNYAMNAKEYRQQVRLQLPEGVSEAAHRAVAKGFGAEVNLDAELMKIGQAVADQLTYMEKKRQWESISEFEARAYLIYRNLNHWKNLKTEIEEQAKRGEGPSMRALMAATGETFDQMLASTDRKGLLFKIESLNEVNYPDVIILMIQDLVQRHPNTVKSINEGENGRVYLTNHLDISKDLGFRLTTTIDGDVVWLEDRQGNTCGLMPTIKGDEADDGRWIHGWEVRFKDGTGVTDAFVTNQVASESNEIRVKLFEALGGLTHLRQELEAAGILNDKYPFYAGRDIHEVTQILDRFQGVDPVSEWEQYQETRAKIMRETRLINMMKQAIKLMAETDTENYQNQLRRDEGVLFLNRDGNYLVKYNPSTGGYKLQRKGYWEASDFPTIEVNLDTNELNITHPETPSHSPLHESAEQSLQNFYELMLQTKVGQVIRRPKEHQRNEASREQALTYAQGWIDRLILKVEAQRKYIDDDKLPDMDPIGDEIIGAFVEWPTKYRGEFTISKGIVTGIDYTQGTITIAAGLGLKGKPITLTSSRFNVLRQDKSGAFVKRSASRHFAIYKSTV